MAYIRLPLGIKVALEYEVFGKIVVNVYHVTTIDPITTIKLFDIADIFADWWADYMSVHFSDDISLTAVTAHNLDEANGAKVIRAISPVVPGQFVSEACSNNVAIVASFLTAKTGRSFRGRAYHAGMPEVAIEENYIGTIKAGQIVTAYGVLDSALNTDDCTLVVASFISEGAARATAIPTPIESYACSLRVDTQRRRLPTE